jgi:diacylglycerol kinase family enzyme
VIFNPAAGKRRARRRLDAVRQDWRAGAAFWPTQRPGHAVELARAAAEGGFEVVAAAGGDGTVHEVANGLLQAKVHEAAFAVLPLGSANDYAFSLQHDRGRVPIDGPAPRRVDVGLIRTGIGLERYFVCSLGIGFSGCVTDQSRRFRHLQGKVLYGVAALRAMWSDWRHLELTVRLDDGAALTGPALMLSLMVGRREGGFLMAPEACLDDGWFDFVHVGPLARWEVLHLLPRLAAAGPPKDHPKVHLGRCRRAVIESQQPLAIHADGEVLSTLAEGITRVEVELLPARLAVRLGLDWPGGAQVESGFPSAGSRDRT